MISRRQFIGSPILTPVVTFVHSWRVEPFWIEYSEYKLTFKNLPKLLAGKTIAHITDIHIGHEVPEDYIVKVFKNIESFKPDFVFHTGDLITCATPDLLPRARQILKHFPHGKIGTFAVLGNHDYGPTWRDGDMADEIERLFVDVQIPVLRNAHSNQDGLQIIGVDDLWSGRLSLKDALQGTDESLPSIMLCHNPDGCDVGSWDKFSGWVISGHTHGGQIKPPFLPPPFLPVKNKRYTSGSLTLDEKRSLYISRGIGI